MKVDVLDTWFAVVNPYAGSGKTLSLWNNAEKALFGKDVSFKSQMTGYKFCAESMAYKACRKGYRKFISVGGDGTVHDVLDGIMKFLNETPGVSLSDFYLAVIPIGSGNDWIKSHNIPKNISEVVSMIESGSFKPQDIVKVSTLDAKAFPEEKVLNSSYMINIGGVGIDARVCKKVNFLKNKGKRGKVLYLKALVECIRERVPVAQKVVCDGEVVFDGLYLSIAFGIGKYSGGGMRQTPEAVLDDGLLDLTVIPDIPMGIIARRIWKLFTGGFWTVKEVTKARGKSILVLPSEGASEPVEVDGEVLGDAPVKLEVLPDRLNVLSAL